MNQAIPPLPGLVPPQVNFPQQPSPMEQDEVEDPAAPSPLTLDQKLQNLINSHLVRFFILKDNIHMLNSMRLT